MTNSAPRAKKPRATAPIAPAPRPIMETIASTGIRLSVGRTTVNRLIKDGKLRTVTLSKRAVRVISADVDALLG